MKFSFTIIILFIVGIVLGLSIDESLITPVFSLAQYTLYGLLVAVGIMVGIDKEHLKAFIKIRYEYLIIPLITLLGTALGSLIVAFCFSNFTWQESLIVGGGLGYYSLSSIIVSEQVSPELGAITLMSNLLREILMILLIPIIHLKCGAYAIISGTGATSMDTTLPIITKTAGNSYTIPAIIHGFILSALVPILLSFLISILIS